MILLHCQNCVTLCDTQNRPMILCVIYKIDLHTERRNGRHFKNIKFCASFPVIEVQFCTRHRKCSTQTLEYLGEIIKLCDWFSANITGKALFRLVRQTNNNDVTSMSVPYYVCIYIVPQLGITFGIFSKKLLYFSDEEVDGPLAAMSVSNWCTNLFIAVHENGFGVFHDTSTCQQQPCIASFTHGFICMLTIN